MGPKRRCFRCKTCNQYFDYHDKLKDHRKKKVKCDHCNNNFCTYEQLQKHKRSISQPINDTADLNQKIQGKTGYNSDAGIQAILLGKLHEISDWVKTGLNYKVINKAINHNFTYKDLLDWLNEIYQKHEHGFKLDLGFGFVLYNPVQDTYKYYYVSDNNMLFDKAFTIDSKTDLNNFIKKVISIDLPTNCYLSKPSSGWVLCSLTNVQAKITNLTNIMIGNGELPSYIKNLKSIRSLTHDSRGKKYNDKLCLWRCMALFHGLPVQNLDNYAKTLCKQFEKFRGKSFEQGITIHDIPLIEIEFKCSINVYSMKENGDIEMLYLSPLNFNVMHVNLFKNHFSYITNINLFAKKFKCFKCDRISNNKANFNKHVELCTPGIREVYLGGKFDAHLETVFEKLEKFDIFVPKSEQYYEFISVFDFEAIQVPDPHVSHGRDILYIHIPATFSVCSNIPGFESPVHIQSDGDPQILVNKMVEIQVEHSKKASLIMRAKFKHIFDQIFTKLEKEIDDVKKSKLKYILGKLIEYCNVLPVISFNGQKYDIPLIRRYLPLALKEKDSLPHFVIKKNRSYMALCTERLRYCDLINYLAAGTSLSKFYAAYKVTSPKGSFPYEYFNSLKRLKDTSLPKRSLELRKAMDEGNEELVTQLAKTDPYFSILKQKTISNEDVDICELEWKNQNMQNFGDFVRYYNDLDVIGLVQGIEKLSKIYFDQGFNMFKDAVSLPKLTQKLIFKPLKEDYFTTFSNQHDYIYQDLRKHVVGGPSIIFTRWQEKNVTLIKNKELCQKIEGYDCNSLYLWAMGLPQPTGPYCLRERSKNFQKHSKNFNDKTYIKYSQKAINWLESIEKAKNIQIRHAENHVHGEKRIQNEYVDGFCDNTIYEFLGCFHHGHSCQNKYDIKKWEQTQTRLNNFKKLGYEVETIWECEWNKPPIPTKPCDPATENDIINGIMQNEIFGIVKCDMKVPKNLENFFTEFSPIFKNTEIELKPEIIAQHMYEYAHSIGRKEGVKNR